MAGRSDADELVRLRAERDAATAQVETILRAKTAAQHEAWTARHDLAGLVACLTGNRQILEAAGVPLPPRHPIPRTEAAILMNCAAAAAEGRSYLPYEQERALRQELKAREHEVSIMRESLRKVESDRERLEQYERDLDEIGRALGCDHKEDGYLRCVLDHLNRRG